MLMLMLMRMLLEQVLLLQEAAAQHGQRLQRRVEALLLLRMIEAGVGSTAGCRSVVKRGGWRREGVAGGSWSRAGLLMY